MRVAKLCLVVAIFLLATRMEGIDHAEPKGVRKSKSKSRVAGIIIVGNEQTDDSLIRDTVSLYVGQQFCDADLRNAETRLMRLGLFHRDPRRAPRITALDSATEFKDIRISVHELPSTRFKLAGFECACWLLTRNPDYMISVLERFLR